MDITNKTNAPIRIECYVPQTGGRQMTYSIVRPGKTMRVNNEHNDIFLLPGKE